MMREREARRREWATLYAEENCNMARLIYRMIRHEGEWGISLRKIRGEVWYILTKLMDEPSSPHDGEIRYILQSKLIATGYVEHVRHGSSDEDHYRVTIRGRKSS